MPAVGLFLECVQATPLPAVRLRVKNPLVMPISRMAIPPPDLEIPTNSSWLVDAFTALMANYPGWCLHRFGTVERDGLTNYHVRLVREDGYPALPARLASPPSYRQL